MSFITCTNYYRVIVLHTVGFDSQWLGGEGGFHFDKACQIRNLSYSGVVLLVGKGKHWGVGVYCGYQISVTSIKCVITNPQISKKELEKFSFYPFLCLLQYLYRIMIANLNHDLFFLKSQEINLPDYCSLF